MTSQTKPSRAELLQRRRRRVCRMYFRGNTHLEIAKKLKISPRTVARDIQAHRREWRKSFTTSDHEIFTAELMRIQQIEATAWNAWNHSLQPEVTNKISVDGEENGGKRKVEQTTREKSGNPRYLELMLRCIAFRTKLFGVFQSESGSFSLEDSFPSENGNLIRLHNEPANVLEQARRRALEEDLHSGDVRPVGESGTMEAGTASGGAGSSFN